MQCHNQNFLETRLTKAEQQAVGLSLGNKPWGWGEQKTNKLKGLLSIGQTDQTNHFHSTKKIYCTEIEGINYQKIYFHMF